MGRHHGDRPYGGRRPGVIRGGPSPVVRGYAGNAPNGPENRLNCGHQACTAYLTMVPITTDTREGLFSMEYEMLAIARTLGARLMAIQAGLLAGVQAESPPGALDAAFEQLVQGPDAQLLYSTWTSEQRLEFLTYMQGVRSKINQQSGTRTA